MIVKATPEELKGSVFSHPGKFNTYGKARQILDNFSTGRKIHRKRGPTAMCGSGA